MTISYKYIKLNFFKMKTNNNIKFIIGLLMLLLVVVSCEDYLDEQPPSAISDEQFWQTDGDAELGVAAIYDAMQPTYNRKHYYWGEFRSDNFVVSEDGGTGETREMITNNLSPQYANSLKWADFYRTISNANLAIQKIPSIEGYNPNLLGEAYAIRAYLYFDAYRIWGGVPLFTEPVTALDDNAYKVRSTAQEVLDLVLSDMETAEGLLTTPTNRYRFSISSLLAFKAKVMMHMQNYPEAKIALDALIGMKQFSLVNTQTAWTNLFTKDNEVGTELILSLRYTLAEDGNNAAQNNIVFFPGVPNNYVSPLVINKWQSKFPTDSTEWVTKYPGIDPPVMKDEEGQKLFGDYRYYETIDQTHTDSTARTAKYFKVSNNSFLDDTDIVIFRYADMLLLKAEVENQLGNPEGALTLVNLIRINRQLPKAVVTDFTNVNDKDEVENFILDERQLELFAEGTRWWDLLRTKKAVEVMGPINGQTEETLLWPIFVDHLIDNPKLIQNTPY